MAYLNFDYWELFHGQYCLGWWHACCFQRWHRHKILYICGLALGAFGIAAATLRFGLFALYRIVMRHVWVSLTLDNRSAAYRHFCIWMEHNNVLAKSRHVRMIDGRWAGGTKGYAPAPGRHWFVWRSNLCRLERDIIEKSKVGSPHNQRPMETLHVTVLFGHISTILEWIAAGRQIAQTRDRIGPGLHILKVIIGIWALITAVEILSAC